MKEFTLIFRLKDIADFKPTPEQIQERMRWLVFPKKTNIRVPVSDLQSL